MVRRLEGSVYDEGQGLGQWPWEEGGFARQSSTGIRLLTQTVWRANPS